MIALNNQMKPERGAPLHLVDFQLGVLQTSKMEISQHTIVAKSQAMQRVLELARRVARSEATVLISGESGTGKERLAQFVHAQSQRSSGPFVAINCGALPEALLESELFGHVKGAFTGAIADTQGLFSAAAGGTLFLDEIGETSLAVQVRLLRALQERTVRPVGATRDRRVDVRVITATNRDLPAMVAAGTFRTDLYYRLRVVALDLPPLRDRPEDLLPLARLFIGQTCGENHCGPCALSAEVLDKLQQHRWPGNIRELQNAIERAVILADGKPRIEIADLPPELRELPRGGLFEERDILTLAEVEQQHIVAVLERLDDNRKATAQALGIGENTLWRKLKSYGMVRERQRGEPD